MITRKRALEEALEVFSTRKRCFSEGMRNLVPMSGYEKAFETENEKCEVIRMIMREKGREPLPPMKHRDGHQICGECGTLLEFEDLQIRCKFCHNCGRAVKW